MLNEIASVNNVAGYVNVDEDIKANISTFSERYHTLHQMLDVTRFIKF